MERWRKLPAKMTTSPTIPQITPMAALLMPQLPPFPPEAPASLSTVGVDAAAIVVGEAVVAVKDEENTIDFVFTAATD